MKISIETFPFRLKFGEEKALETIKEAGMDKGMMKCIHIQDTNGKIDGHLIPYSGVHNWDGIMKALAEYGYDGTLDMEIIHCFDGLPKELYLPLLRYAATVGKTLVGKFGNYNN